MLTGIAIGLIIACAYPTVFSIYASCSKDQIYFCWDEYFPVGVCVVIISGAIGFLIGGV